MEQDPFKAKCVLISLNERLCWTVITLWNRYQLTSFLSNSPTIPTASLYHTEHVARTKVWQTLRHPAAWVFCSSQTWIKKDGGGGFRLVFPVGSPFTLLAPALSRLVMSWSLPRRPPAVTYVCSSDCGVSRLRRPFCGSHNEGTSSGQDSLFSCLSMIFGCNGWRMCVPMGFDIHFAACPNR